MPPSEGGMKKFRLEQLFQSANGDRDIQKIHLNGKGEAVVSSGESNNGIVGKTDITARVFPSDTITVDMFGNAYYQLHPYKMVTHARVFSLSPIGEMRLNEKIGLYLVARLRYLKQIFSYNNMCSWEKIRQQIIELPVDKYGAIAFDYIEERVRELEEERVRELEAYLLAAGFADCSLTAEEQAAIQAASNYTHWGKFRIGDLFMPLRTIKANKNNVRKQKNEEFCVPVVYCKYGDNGIMYWGREGEFTTYENVISVVYNGVIAAGKVYAQKEKTGILAECYFIKHKNREVSHDINLFFATALEKCIYPKYSRDDLAIWNKRVENDLVSLPVAPNGEIDYHFMETYISAVKKQVVQRLKAYIEQEKQAYQKAIV